MTSACWSQDTAARAQGMELEARGEILPGLEFIGSYTWTDAKITRMDPESEMLLESISQMGYLPEGFRPRPVGVPEHMVSLWANYTFPGDALDGLSIGGGVRYVGRMAATFSNVWYDEYSWAMPDSGNPLDSPTFLKRAWVPSRTLFDLSLSYDFGRKFQNLDGMSLNVVATNIFDKKYVAACNGYGTCTYGDGRDIRATLRYRW
jgi:iron complex outermembrane receptor protein